MAKPAKAMAKKFEEWQDVVDEIKPYIVQIWTPRGRGTGFLFAYTKDQSICGIATAAHVIDQAHFWEEPIRILHQASGKLVMTHKQDRAIRVDEKSDTAAIIIPKGELGLPEVQYDLAPKERYLRVGNEVGWLGFPAILFAPEDPCFFSGRISSWLTERASYLVDGVAINGVSGGPAFHPSGGNILVMGVVSAYIPNRATGEALPGVCVISSVHHLQKIVEELASFQEAKKQETKATEVQPPTATDRGPSAGNT